MMVRNVKRKVKYDGEWREENYKEDGEEFIHNNLSDEVYLLCSATKCNKLSGSSTP